MSYGNTSVSYERQGDKVTPIRTLKQWVSYGDEKKPRRKFISVRSTVVPFGAVNQGPEEWSSTKVPPMDRGALIAAGLLRPVGHGQACLELDDPSGWMASVVNNPLPPWTEPYGIGTDESQR